MSDRKVQVFLYGPLSDMAALTEIGLKRRAFAPASLGGFDLIIQPVANIVEVGDGVVYGVIANFTHAEIAILEATQNGSLTSAAFNPEPVIVRTRGGRIVPALTYLSTNLDPSFAKADYVKSLLATADKYGFPRWYLDRIEAFKPQPAS
ncbi:MAG: gamma-glutamylcyclotransferase [Kordiimonadaceae bacterium]|nr:gamma-glutamylcyclotransferase [Kordiimonadaceae bacterium]